MLHQHPVVHQAAVFGTPSRVMGELVCAAVTLRPEAAAGGAEQVGLGTLPVIQQAQAQLRSTN